MTNPLTKLIASFMESPEQRAQKIQAICDETYRDIDIVKRRWDLPTKKYGYWQDPRLYTNQDEKAAWIRERMAPKLRQF